MLSPTASSLPYADATAAQRAQVLRYLQARLQHHFPTLPERAFVRGLAELRPDLQLTGGQLTLAPLDLTQLVQYLGHAVELPLLDPPLYGPWALELATWLLHARELAAAALPELYPGPPAGPRLLALLRYLNQPQPLAEQIVQAQRWDLPGSPPLPPGLPGRRPAPGSAEGQHYLVWLGRAPAP